jgi:hypothetical protein
VAGATSGTDAADAPAAEGSSGAGAPDSSADREAAVEPDAAGTGAEGGPTSGSPGSVGTAEPGDGGPTPAAAGPTASAPAGSGADTAAGPPPRGVHVEVRHDPSAGTGWSRGIGSILSWLGQNTAFDRFEGAFDLPIRDPERLATDAVAATEITWSAVARRLTVRSRRSCRCGWCRSPSRCVHPRGRG